MAGLPATALLTASLDVPDSWLPAAATACWISILAAAACVHLPRGLNTIVVALLCLSGGVSTGAVAGALGGPLDLWTALPWTLVCLPGAALVARGRGVAIKVVLSWLAAAAVLSLGLNMAPTLGYEPDHMS